jgi:hypothetical protein
MMLIFITPGGVDEACWRYAYQVPTQEDLDAVRASMPGTFTTEVALVFFEGDHAAIHAELDKRFPSAFPRARNEDVKLRIVPPLSDTPEG